VALAKKLEGSKRANEQSVELDTAIIQSLKCVDKNKKRLADEVAIYRTLTQLEDKFDEELQEIAEERARLDAREVELRARRNTEKQELKEVLPFSKRF
jgi:uncharacterized protein YwqG